MASLCAEETSRLYEAVKAVLCSMTDQGGRDTEGCQKM